MASETDPGKSRFEKPLVRTADPTWMAISILHKFMQKREGRPGLRKITPDAPRKRISCKDNLIQAQ